MLTPSLGHYTCKSPRSCHLAALGVGVGAVQKRRSVALVCWLVKQPPPH